MAHRVVTQQGVLRIRTDQEQWELCKTPDLVVDLKEKPAVLGVCDQNGSSKHDWK